MFGGFNKQDVMQYIEQLQNELAELKEQFASLQSDFAASQQELERIPALEQQAEEKAQLEKERELLTERIRVLEEDNKKATDEYEKVKQAEAQLGAAFVDARRYSDRIVAAAKERAEDVSKQASDDISLKAEQIRSVAAEADRITVEMRRRMEALSKSIADLSGKMSAVAVTLVKTEAPADFKPRVDFELLSEMGIEDTGDIASVETDEETGMTFISYEPNTDFNGDLNFDESDFGNQDVAES